MEQNPLREMMKARRDEIGLTQKDAAKRAGVHVTTWNRWENEFTTPDDKVWHRIAQALDLQLEDVRRVVFEGMQDHFNEVKTRALLEGFTKTSTPLPGYKLRNQELAELDKRLEIDFTSVDSAHFQRYLDDSRTLLRNQIVSADLHILSMRQAVELFRRFTLTILGLPKAIFRPPIEKVRVRRKAAQKNSEDGAECESPR